MFSSLDRADISLAPTSAGNPQFVQTDHRSPEEIRENPELSAVMALVRIVNPKRVFEDGAPEPIVIYMCDQDPPLFLKQIISAAGATLAFGGDISPQSLPAAEPLGRVLNDAMHELSSAVIKEYSIELNESAVSNLEQSLSPPAAESDEFLYWSAVLKLGAVGGELIKQTNGGEWAITDTGSLPFALATNYNGESATVNPLGKAIKYFNNGEEDSLVSLISVLKANP